MLLTEEHVTKLKKLLIDRPGSLRHFRFTKTKITSHTGIVWESYRGPDPFVFGLFVDEDEFREVGQMKLSVLQNHLDEAIGDFERDLESILEIS